MRTRVSVRIFIRLAFFLALLGATVAGVYLLPRWSEDRDLRFHNLAVGSPTAQHKFHAGQRLFVAFQMRGCSKGKDGQCRGRLTVTSKPEGVFQDLSSLNHPFVFEKRSAYTFLDYKQYLVIRRDFQGKAELEFKLEDQAAQRTVVDRVVFEVLPPLPAEAP